MNRMELVGWQPIRIAVHSLRWILKGIRNVNECQFYFTRPTEGHTWRLEKSMDGKNWRTCAEQAKVEVRSPHLAKEIGEARYLRLHIRRGDAGLWEWKIYEK